MLTLPLPRTPWLGSTPAPGVAGRALAASGTRAVLARTFETFRCARVFREGAENRVRGRARSPALLAMEIVALGSSGQG